MQSIRWLNDHGKLTGVRLLVNEGLTDTPEELEAWGPRFVVGVNPQIPVWVLGFPQQGTGPQARVWPETSPQTLTKVAETLRRCGLTAVTADAVQPMG